MAHSNLEHEDSGVGMQPVAGVSDLASLSFEPVSLRRRDAPSTVPSTGGGTSSGLVHSRRLAYTAAVIGAGVATGLLVRAQLLIAVLVGTAVLLVGASLRLLQDRRRDRAAPTPGALQSKSVKWADGWAALSHVARAVPADFIEEVEIRYIIGKNASEDQVVERHRTTPVTATPCRVIRLTLPRRSPGPRPVQQVQIAGENEEVAPTVIPLDAEDGHQVAVVFEPSLSTTYTWTVAYKVPGMWDPLRNNGVDTLLFSVGSRLARGRSASYASKITIQFLFPSSSVDCKVDTLDGEGELHGERKPTGQTESTWTWVCENPRPTADPETPGQARRWTQAAEYGWQLHMRPSRWVRRVSSGGPDNDLGTIKVGGC
jgi:hypothetical protein